MPLTAQELTPSAWGTVITLGEAEQQSAPALWVNRPHVISAWVAASDEGVRQYLRAYTPPDALSGLAFLPIPPVFPHQQTLIPAGDDDTAHLFWLDAAQRNIDNGLRLWGDIVTTDLARIRAEIPLSDDVTYHYDAIELPDGDAQIIWSAGNPAEPTLFTRQVDGRGRPRTVRTLAPDADWPTLLTRADGRIAVYWLSPSQGTVGRVIIADDNTTAPEILMQSVYLAPGDHLLGFEVGQDQTHTYLFWTVRRAGGLVETWFSTSPIEADQWSDPTSLAIDLTPDSEFVTGFNGGDGVAATDGTTPVLWSMPLAGRFDVLPLAAQVADGLGLLYLQAGEVVGYQRVVILAEPGLIGFPSLQVDRDRHLYLTWAQPVPSSPATLKLTTTR